MTLNLGINDIGDDGVKMMKEGLEANSSLTALGLRYNHVGNGGARMIQEALLTNTTLTALYGVDEIRVSEEHFGESPNSSKAEHKCPDSSDKQE